MQKSFLRPSLAGFQPYGPGDQPADEELWIKLNTNESPIGPSPKVIEAIHAATGDQLRFYPSPSAAAARVAIAKRFDLAPEMIVLGNGADELIEMCFRAFAGAGDQVAFATPTYPLLEPVAAIHECEVSPHPMGEGWEMPPTLAEDPARLTFVVNPNSPTGTWHRREVIEPIVDASSGVVVLDEAYVDFAPEPRLDLLETHDNLVILRTMSKSYALAGMRIGFAIGNPQLIAAMDLVKDVYNLDRLAIVAAAAAIADADHHRMLVEQVTSEREWLSAELSKLAFDVAPSATNFLFVRPPRPARGVADELRARRILVRHYEREPISGWLRITIGTRRQHEQLLEALKEIHR
jgi:histidinol-phosphate aminotransferase